MVVTEHDRLHGPRVFVTRGAIHRVTPARLGQERQRFPGLASLPRPILGVLIGGSNRAYRLDLRRLGEIADTVAATVRQTGGSVVLTPSRRTGAAGITRPFAGHLERWSYDPPDDTARAGAALRELVLARLAERQQV